jgi:hypothetical protein
MRDMAIERMPRPRGARGIAIRLIGSGAVDNEDLLVSAALLGRGQDSHSLVADLAARFERALPSHVNIDWSGWGKRRSVKSLTINMDQERFRIEVHNGILSPWIDQVVRGICLRSVEVGMDDWLDRFAATLNREAKKSIETRLAIEEALQ